MGQSFKAKLSNKMKSLFSVFLISCYIAVVFGNKYQELLEVQKSSSKIVSGREDYNGLGTVQPEVQLAVQDLAEVHLRVMLLMEKMDPTGLLLMTKDKLIVKERSLIPQEILDLAIAHTKMLCLSENSLQNC